MLVRHVSPWMGVCVGVQIIGWLGACGPARSVPLSSEAIPPAKEQVDREEFREDVIRAGESPRITKNLGLLVLPEAAERGYPHLKIPDSNENSGQLLNQTARSHGNQIVFFGALHLPHPESPNPFRRKELFFVWPENSLGSPVVQAWVTHRVLDGNNRWFGSPRVFPARRDVHRQRWFISILDFLKPTDEVNEAATQVLYLDLTLADQTSTLVEVRFRVSRQTRAN